MSAIVDRIKKSTSVCEEGVGWATNPQGSCLRPGVPEAVEILFWLSILECVEHSHNVKLLYLAFTMLLVFQGIFETPNTFDVVVAGFSSAPRYAKFPAPAE